MSVSEMTIVSYFFMIMAGVFGIITVVMYFAMDIKRCWSIVRGKHVAVPREKTPYDVGSDAEQQRNSKISEQTKKHIHEETETLFLHEETELLETIALVQDIVIMDVEGCR